MRQTDGITRRARTWWQFDLALTSPARRITLTPVTTSCQTALGHAHLPEAYQSAQLALANCVKLDECKDWADKAAALASYARMSNDDTLQNHAIRIQSRVIERCGLLMHLIPSGTGQNQGERTGTDTFALTRSQTAEEAGLSEHQRTITKP
jgi:hypothetical protein